jgi:hypothetical protein
VLEQEFSTACETQRKGAPEIPGAPSLRKYSPVPPEPAKPNFSTLYGLRSAVTGCS